MLKDKKIKGNKKMALIYKEKDNNRIVYDEKLTIEDIDGKLTHFDIKFTQNELLKFETDTLKTTKNLKNIKKVANLDNVDKTNTDEVLDKISEISKQAETMNNYNDIIVKLIFGDKTPNIAKNELINAAQMVINDALGKLQAKKNTPNKI